MNSVVAGTVSMSLDGFMAGPAQSNQDPLGVGGRRLHEWISRRKSGGETNGETASEENVDDDVFGDDAETIGATIMGRNMFGPIRGPWEGSEWRGWWGDEPPYGHPVFVLTHFERPDVAVGTTTFSFVTDGVHEALRRARVAAGDHDVHVAGGAATLRQFLDASLIDVLRVAMVPMELHAGARLVESAGRWPGGYRVRRTAPGEGVTHYELCRE